MTPFERLLAVIEDTYSFAGWEGPGNTVELTLYTSRGEVSEVVSKSEAEAIVARLYEKYPHWRPERGSNG